MLVVMPLESPVRTCRSSLMVARRSLPGMTASRCQFRRVRVDRSLPPPGKYMTSEVFTRCGGYAVAMSKWVALIRGVGGPTALRMADLRLALEGAGLSGVATLQVAGNVVFDQEDRSMTACAELVRRTVHRRFGHDLPVIVRSHEQLVDAERRNPFVGTHEGRLVMTVFLEVMTRPCAVLDPEAGMPDLFVVDGEEVFVRYASAVAGSKLQSAWFEKRLGAVGTARNANTVAKLVQLTV